MRVGPLLYPAMYQPPCTGVYFVRRSWTTDHPTTQEGAPKVTIPLHTVPGRELPPLLWYHQQEEDAQQVAARFRPPLFDGWHSKPEGGLWAAVLRDFYGLGLSAWGEFEDNVEVKGHAYVSTVVPDPDARFVVIDSEADAVAVAQAFPGVEGEGTLAKLLAAEGDGPHIDGIKERLHEARRLLGGQAPIVDFTQLAQHQYAGVHLTDRGRMETKYMRPSKGVPSLWGWDVECVWFRAPELRVQDTRRWERV